MVGCISFGPVAPLKTDWDSEVLVDSPWEVLENSGPGL